MSSLYCQLKFYVILECTHPEVNRLVRLGALVVSGSSEFMIVALLYSIHLRVGFLIETVIIM